MYAIVEIGGRQHVMQPNQTVKVDRQAEDTGEQITLDRVLAIKGDDGELRVGRPYLDDATVTARVVQQGRDRKITVVKFKAKKRYRRKVGHRQHFTALEVLSIDSEFTATAEPAEEPEEAPEVVETAAQPEEEAVEVAEETTETAEAAEATADEASSDTGDDSDGS
jgi:large subunit ribosomal protein L21